MNFNFYLHLMADMLSLSDAELVAACAQVVSVPRSDPEDSFTLHAPLELIARSALLPLVAEAARPGARSLIARIAERYATYRPVPVVENEVEIPPLSLIVHSTAAAAHAPIFFAYTARREQLSGWSPLLLRPLVQSLANDPTWRFSWTDAWRPAATTDLEGLQDALLTAPADRVTNPGLVHPLMMQVDQAGIAADLLGPILGPRTLEAERVVIRTAAHSMLTGDPAGAKYGWTHCLTLPQALLEVTRGTGLADIGLALAATEVLAFRASFDNPALSAVPESTGSLNVGANRTALATAAATHSDAHVAKYTLACLDAAHDDPSAAPLYLAAAQHLLDHWALNPVAPVL